MFHHHHGAIMATHTEPTAAQVRPLHATPALTLAKVGGRYIRAAEVTAICGVGKSYIYAHMKAGTFPKCLQLPGGKAVAWRESDLAAWMASVDAANSAGSAGPADDLATQADKQAGAAAGPDRATQGGAS